MNKKLLTFFIYVVISLTFISCGKNYEHMNGQDCPDIYKIYFCKDFKHDIDLVVKFYNGKTEKIIIDEKCDSMCFQDSVESISVISYFGNLVPIQDSDVNNTEVIVRYGWIPIFPDGIGAAIYTDKQVTPAVCGCIPVSKQTLQSPGIKGQRIKAVYMQDM